MTLTYRRCPWDFRGVAPKSGHDIVGVTYDRHDGTPFIGVRVWKSTGNEDEYHSTNHGLNLPVGHMADAFLFLCQVLGGEADEMQFPMDRGRRIFRVNQQQWKGHNVISARVHTMNKDGTTRPTRNGVTLRREVWLSILGDLESTLQEFGDLGAFAEARATAALSHVLAQAALSL